MKKRTLTILCLVVSALMLLTSCGGTAPAASSAPASSTPAAESATVAAGSSAAATTEATADSEPVQTNGPMSKYDPPITITRVVATDDTLENNTLSKLPGETIDDNRWTRLINDELGIKIVNTWIAKGADEFNQKFNVSIATGDIPDLIDVNATQLKQLADADLLADLTQILPDFATPLSKKIIDDGGPAALSIATVNGKLLGVPRVNANHEWVNFIWLRTDWMTAYGLQPPKTMADLENILKVFVEKGKPGTVGMALQKDLWGQNYAVLDGFFNGYHAYPNTWVEKDGKMAYGSIQPEMKVALAKLADMYKAGLIDKEFAVKDSGKEAELTISGLNGAFYGAHWNGLYPLQNNRTNDPKADWRAFPIVSADDKVAMTQSVVGTSDWFAMSKNCKNPEAVMKLFNMYVKKTFDPDNQEYVKYSNPPGTEGVWKLSPVVTYLAVKNLDNYRNIQEPLKNKDPGKLFGEQLAMYENCLKFLNGDETCWGWNKTFGKDSSWSVTDQYETEKRVLLSGYAGAPTPTMVEKKTTLDKMQNELVVKIIMGQAEVSAFDKFTTDWLALGGQAITDEINAALGK